MKDWQIGMFLGLLGCQESSHLNYWETRIEQESVNFLNREDTNLEGLIEERNNWGIIAVDMQPYFLGKLSKDTLKELVANQREVLNYALEYDIPVVVFESEPESKYGTTISEIREYVELVRRHYFFGKEQDGGFMIDPEYGGYEGDPEDILNGYGVETLYIMGVNTESCVFDTSKEAHYLGFIPSTTRDVIASEYHENYSPNLAKAFNFFLDEGFFGATRDLVIEDMERENGTKF